MGLDAIYGIWSSIANFSVDGVAGWLAVIGFSIIVIVALAYGIYGTVRLVKWISTMRVKEFSLLLLAIGIILIGAAAILP